LDVQTPPNSITAAKQTTWSALGWPLLLLLFTLPWSPDPTRRGIFHFIPDDHAVIDRQLLKDTPHALQ
jgi:hypothetical protein